MNVENQLRLAPHPELSDRAMEGYEPVTSFGEDTAEIYDATSQRGDEEATVAFLERMADGGRVLELAIGTGRIALPLAERGVDIEGIDIAPAMVAKLRAKPGGDKISVTMGNFAEVPVPGSFRLIFVVYNTLFNLLTQDEQVRCFENVATHLADDGKFVVEAMVPDYLYRLRNDQYVDAEAIGVGVCRYAWPSELDLMARLAGLRLKERWSGWNEEPFTSSSARHVSVYAR